tara:strand:- start:4443 stop:5354 length:912 start_codon:yes stop_codon:yes gene_type:complete
MYLSTLYIILGLKLIFSLSNIIFCAVGLLNDTERRLAEANNFQLYILLVNSLIHFLLTTIFVIRKNSKQYRDIENIITFPLVFVLLVPSEHILHTIQVFVVAFELLSVEEHYRLQNGILTKVFFILSFVGLFLPWNIAMLWVCDPEHTNYFVVSFLILKLFALHYSLKRNSNHYCQTIRFFIDAASFDNTLVDSCIEADYFTTFVLQYMKITLIDSSIICQCLNRVSNNLSTWNWNGVNTFIASFGWGVFVIYIITLLYAIRIYYKKTIKFKILETTSLINDNITDSSEEEVPLDMDTIEEKI